MDIIQEGKKVFEIEIEYLKQVMGTLDERFIKIIHAIKDCKGKVIITGMGKPGHIGRKIAATMSSLGTSAFYLHPAEALHGDLGMVEEKDILIVFSNSGESDEIIRILPNIKMIGAKIIGITSNNSSTLCEYSDYLYVLPEVHEACKFNLAPSSSTTAELVFGDALAIVLSRISGFSEHNYALYHPGGSLGKKLLIKVKDIMRSGEDNAKVTTNSTLEKAILEMSRKPLSIISIIDEEENILGVFSDGDLRRLLEKNINIYDCFINDVMMKAPTVINKEVLAVEALRIMNSKRIGAMPVLDDNKKVVGTVVLHDIIKVGIV